MFERLLHRTRCIAGLAALAALYAGGPARAAERVSVPAQVPPVAAPAVAAEATGLTETASESESEPAPLPGLPSPQELEERGAIIGLIIVQPDEIFDESLPSESGWVYRAANKIHIRTKPYVVRKQLLFDTGQPFRVRLIEESERLLRENNYLYEAKIRPIAYDGKTVDLEVRTKDVWTLNPGINFGRKGGQNEGGAQIEENNLLGTGQAIKLVWEKNVDRESVRLAYSNPHFLHSFGRLGITYQDADDGESKILLLDRPFYALDTRLAGGTLLNDTLQQDPRYALGHEVGKFEHHDEYYELYGGVSNGLQHGWVTRWTAGLSYSRDRFTALPDEELGGPLPGNRELVYPWIGVEWVQDAYQERKNQDQIVRTEDVLVGIRAGVRVGYASESFGSDRDAWILHGYLQDGKDLGPGQSLFGTVVADGRIEDGGIANGVLSAEARYYLRTSKRTKFFAAVSGTTTENLDLENQLLLGGDNGLRGYPLRYQGGTSMALLTFEERYYTNWYPFRLFHVAAATFFDMGRTWGPDVTGAENLGLLKDVGIGLRFGSSRSSFGNVIHVDLAFPLDGDPSIDKVQFVVETKAKF